MTDRRDSGIDLQAGGTYTWPDGRSIDIQSHSDRVYATAWPNGAFVEVLVYIESQPDAVESDRIHMLITPAGEDRDGWLMCIQDAEEIIKGLETAIAVAHILGIAEREECD